MTFTFMYNAWKVNEKDLHALKFEHKKINSPNAGKY